MTSLSAAGSYARIREESLHDVEVAPIYSLPHGEVDGGRVHKRGCEEPTTTRRGRATTPLKTTAEPLTLL
jgi:hypothetical protein